MVKAIKKAWTAVLVAVATLFGTLAFAAPAMAYTDYYSHYELSPCYHYGSGPGSRYITYWYWRDYDWWEETFQGKRDGYVNTGGQWYSYC